MLRESDYILVVIERHFTVPGLPIYYSNHEPSFNIIRMFMTDFIRGMIVMKYYSPI